MGYKQKVGFDPKKMGTTPGMCLGNVRKGYGIPGKYHDAKAAMLAARSHGKLHPMNTIPTNCAVPVFADTASVYEHVMVDYYGTMLSDGKVVSNPQAFKYFGWSEELNDVQIVDYVEDPKPKKSNAESATEVIEGKWGNAPERYTRLREAGYDPAVIQAMVNEMVKGDSNIRVGDRVLPKTFKDYYGKTLKKTRDFYFVKQISGDRVVLVVDNVNGAVYAAVKKDNVRKV